MNIYDRYVLPRLTNLACGSKPTRRQREKIVHLAYGDVLEIGFGGGLNLAHYDAGKVRKVFGLEPSEGMRASARARIDASSLDVELIDLPGEEIPLDDNSVDSVLVTYTLCTIPDAVTALRGMRRVLKPRGHLFFCEGARRCSAQVAAARQPRMAAPGRRVQHGPRHSDPAQGGRLYDRGRQPHVHSGPARAEL